MQFILSTALSLLAFTSNTLAACTRCGSVEITFFRYPDNDPPSAQTAYNCGGRNYIAGGTGTYDDPLTMASASGEFSQCEVVYVPYLEKYVRCMWFFRSLISSSRRGAREESERKGERRDEE